MSNPDRKELDSLGLTNRMRWQHSTDLQTQTDGTVRRGAERKPRLLPKQTKFVRELDRETAAVGLGFASAEMDQLGWP